MNRSHTDVYTLVRAEAATNSARCAVLASIRYRLSSAADSTVIAYLPQLTRCGNTLRVSRYRRTHWASRQSAGNVDRKPISREWLELHCCGAAQSRAYRQKKSSMFCWLVSTRQALAARAAASLASM